MHRTFLLLILLLLFSYSPGKKRFKEIDQFAGHFLNSTGGTGLAIGIINHEKQFEFYYGHSKPGSDKRINRNSLFEIGSVTKIFTTLLLADFIVKNNFSLEVNALNFLTDSILCNSREKISFKELATHTSGLPRLGGNFWEKVTDQENPYSNYDTEDGLKFLASFQRSGKESRYLYSNYGIGLLGYILSRTNGTSYESLLRNKILTPLKLNNTFIKIPENKEQNLVTGTNKGKCMKGWDFKEFTVAHGGLHSNIPDLLKFLKINLKPENKIFHPEIKLMQDIHYRNENNEGLSMGLGWHITQLNNKKMFEHTGGTGGFRSFIALIPSSNCGIVILTNSTNDVRDMGIEILKLLEQPKN